jgi:hypothetical protein
MPIGDDEAQLWERVLARERPRDAGAELGIHPKRVIALCLKWSRQGRYDYGVAADMGWPTGG